MAVRSAIASALLGLVAVSAHGEAAKPLPQLHAYQVKEEWRTPVQPLRVAEHTWQIGTEGLSSLLLTTKSGAVLIDGGMPQAADHLLENLRVLGLAPTDLKLILQSHGHGDHAGSLAAVARATGAQVVSNAETAQLMARGGSNDIHFGDGIIYPPLQTDRLVHDGEKIRLGELELQVHFVPGHTPGSMAWTWRDRRDGKLVNVAYVDSLTAPGYQLLNNPRYPRIVDDYQHSFDTVRALPCDLLLTPHPNASGWEYGMRAVQEKPIGCRVYADNAQRVFEQQLAEQKSAQVKSM
ncbi:subclass B3 metallo-beta-lactamase [Microbulbifer hainanensis]|uniref:subclass B3 metallo-beta-lactamase n=1 Tax=Microbulbifer hainanensis TaxID=2735675 RepID=UPI001866BD81|nr:subclass B3 metallo-beta-lactamase [Microbulbifer hainanensis]